MNTLKNQARLNSKNLDELEKNYIRNMKIIHGGVVKFKNWKDFHFEFINISHDNPLNVVRRYSNNTSKNYLGFRGWIKGEWLVLPTKNLIDSPFCQTACFSTQLGFHTGTFNGGVNFSGEFRLYLDDFPLIKFNILNIISEKELEKVFKTDSELKAFVRKAKLDSIFESTL
jgi:hypothetical protein